MEINNVIIPCQKSARDTSRWDIHIQDGKVSQIRPSERPASEPSKLLLPPLCHPHIHLDKPFILTCNHNLASDAHPDYSDLIPETGSFAEALLNTSRAKERYTEHDLYLRGSQLLATSYKQGVTSLRAFIEIDHVTGSLPLTVAIRLKSDFSHLLEMQLCAFAQDPLFSTRHGETNRSILTSLLKDHASSLHVLGTTPYVEESREASLQNIDWAITTALRHNLHLDFHLDYNLTPPSPLAQPLTFSVIQLLRKHDWLGQADRSKTIVLGHCTQLTVLSDSDLRQLAETIIQSRLPIHFVGLPTSDMFMMGRPTPATASTQVRPRGTLHVPSMIKDLGLSACIGVNNVGNAFTPFGSGDPLQMASYGVGIYQAGTVSDATTLYGCVSWLARRAIGLEQDEEYSDIVEGRFLQGMLLLKNEEHIELPGPADGSRLILPARQRKSLKDIIWDPPGVELRSILR
ncbi:Metallo-dependent hydrolase [Hypoxylon rubiginosum]|uniref:Metallo-dependent hydrolase n=1 Tax=Hypoxylon rubiginosum TaxID=110542 RepID=A0ACB9YYN7_9PEZI|nr:Metallo-dependent hydrolase [Hypoxylon rubiginosum]